MITRRHFIFTAPGVAVLPVALQQLSGAPQTTDNDPLRTQFLKQAMAVLKEHQENNHQLTRDIAGRLAIATRTLAVYGVSKNVDGKIQSALKQAIKDRGRNALLIGGATDEAINNVAKNYGLDISYELRTATPMDPRTKDQALDALLNGKMKLTEIFARCADTFDKARPKLAETQPAGQLQKAMFQACQPSMDPCEYYVNADNVAQAMMFDLCVVLAYFCPDFVAAWLAARIALAICRYDHPC